MESNQAQVIRQDLRNFSGAVQNMVQGVRAASISWGDQNYQMLFRSIQGLSIKSKRVLDSGNRAAQAAERFFEISQEQYPSASRWFWQTVLAWQSAARWSGRYGLGSDADL